MWCHGSLVLTIMEVYVVVILTALNEDNTGTTRKQTFITVNSVALKVLLIRFSKDHLIRIPILSCPIS